MTIFGYVVHDREEEEGGVQLPHRQTLEDDSELGWETFVQISGNEVMIKSVAQAIPTYSMNTFLLPESFGEELEHMMNSFC